MNMTGKSIYDPNKCLVKTYDVSVCLESGAVETFDVSVETDYAVVTVT